MILLPYTCDPLPDPEFPEYFAINKVYPNPFNPIANISIDIPETSEIKVVIYDLNGKVVDLIFDGKINAGIHDFNWDARTFSSGIYFVTLIEESGQTFNQKITLIK